MSETLRSRLESAQAGRRDELLRLATDDDSAEAEPELAAALQSIGRETLELEAALDGLCRLQALERRALARGTERLESRPLHPGAWLVAVPIVLFFTASAIGHGYGPDANSGLGWLAAAFGSVEAFLWVQTKLRR